MSTTWRENYSFPRIFKDRRGAPDPAKVQGSAGRRQEEKRTLPRTPADVSAFSYVAVENPHPGAGILTGFPFGTRRTRAPFKRNFPMP
ncbi:hypothetical protein BO83DRAFT_327785 [Aspergillus eucalypticola CBS 122712]|uniref:Uncharacterized protein n=1 Tax=Aspergillus eucalypticola (strain CBS 122712 / IBT 29274) TaxID=1448314 RepID=A0A317ULP0_ASPEC|nr:uncharacterized protein BO83DRAFT_327879 [Aspergillus eucalypticola CBS 122712]XP_025381696.1 uncharacterized protein BO83DRAFT_327785 [Aspergillus eucalypticola CBS 122712]PWY61452.1 hypothetical protein BO83DRAFT_327879 [Aspergillus eucalypticola CBS 122712]PWY61515.1 hypothetical protein BO83DRAFT_327785 [Aspergillus eucalypticola CBS 122712]